ncbi:RadC family protein [Photobacterium kishitanii]|uniref:RadC family protein n=1 Tax=Photobacterium kishitanii TaxID=318456 RepID=UPI000435B3BA|nr:DNA repair protein RadC [Photobacterium kishitanii]CEO40195.1 putative DNA repair protein; CP4-57 prophage. In SS9 WAP3 not in 3TCK [Photobacterium kishitanii]
MHKPNDYVVHTPMTADQVLEKAAEIVANRYLRGDVFTNPQATKDFLQYKMAGYEREVFAVLLLDNQHRLIEYKELFFGTIDAASVYPREVVKVAFNCNAAAVIFAHNHPSGIAEPSNADKHITQKLRDALALIDIRVLDHFVVGETCVSFAEQGYL